MEHDRLSERGTATAPPAADPITGPAPYIPPQWSPHATHPDYRPRPLPTRPPRTLRAQYVMLGIPVALLLVGLLIAQLLVLRGGTSTSPISRPLSRWCDFGASTMPCPYAPRDLRAAYNIAPLLRQGIDGSGQTVMLLEQPGPPTKTTNIYQDLAAFDRLFHLPPAQLSVDNVFAADTAPESADSEEVLDAEVLHSIAPGAGIRVVLATNSNFYRALEFSSTNQLGDVISISMGGGEHCLSPAIVSTIHGVLSQSAERGVSVIASSGDFGAVADPCQSGKVAPSVGVNLPAADPLVTAVGGTRLMAQAGQPYQGEDSWNTPLSWTSPTIESEPKAFGGVPHSQASGGGFSQWISRPDFQNGIPGIADHRAIPDVAAMSAPEPGVAFVEVVGDRTKMGLVYGTSVAAPLWAGLAAMADQLAGHRLGPLNPAIYQIAKSPEYASAFHDVTSGSNSVSVGSDVITGQWAAPGWDPVTGWGSPDAAVLIPLLAHPASR